MIKRTGAYTIAFESRPVIAGWGSVVGKKEAEGPLKNYFDKIIYDSYDGCDTFEQAESMFQGESFSPQKASKYGFNLSQFFRLKYAMEISFLISCCFLSST